jgi:hypothetical protein
VGVVSRIRRLRLTDRIFFVTVNLHRHFHPLIASEYPILIEALEGARLAVGLPALRLRPDAGPLACLDLDRISSDHFPGDSRCEESLSTTTSSRARNTRAGVAASILGAVHPREFSERLGVHASQSRAQGVGEQARALAMVKLQQFLTRPGDRGGLRHSG